MARTTAPHYTTNVTDEALVTGPERRASASMWGRRLVAVPLYALGWVLVTATAPLWLVLGGLADLLRGTSVVRGASFAWVFLTCELGGVLVAIVFGLLPGSPDRVIARHFRLQVLWAGTLRRAAFSLFSVTTASAGTECATKGPMLLFVRHCSLADTLLPMMLVSEPHGVVLRWVMKRELLWDPCLNIVGHQLRNVFVTRGGGADSRDVEAIVELGQNLGDHGIAIYPEGTRFSPGKRARLIARGDAALKARAESFQSVLPPRPGGVLALLDQHPEVDVVFCAHRGLERSASPRDLFGGGFVRAELYAEMWRVPYGDIPSDREARVEWLHEQWKRVDEVASGGSVSGSVTGERR